MAIAYVSDTGRSRATSGTNDTSFAAGKPAAGALLIIPHTGKNGYTTTSYVTDNQSGNTYVNDAKFQESGFGTWWVTCHSAVNVNVSGTFTLHNRVAGQDENNAIGIEVSGGATSTPFDQSKTGQTGWVNADNNYTTGTLAQADEFIITCATGRVNPNAASAFAKPASPWTLLSTVNLGDGTVNNSPSAFYYQVVAATTAVTATWNLTVTAPAFDIPAVLVACYKGAASAANRVTKMAGRWGGFAGESGGFAG